MTVRTEGPDAWLIRKGSYFYRPNCQGYTANKQEAGRYPEAKAKAEASVEPWHMSAVLADDVPDAPTSSPSFQQRVQPWMLACFGPAIAADKLERGDRLLEEVLELLQSVDYPRERIASLSSYVWSRQKGEPAQEVGGSMVTLAAFCLAHDLDMHAAGETELARIWTKVEAIRAKQAAKPTGSALPVAEKFVRAIERRILSALEPARVQEGAEPAGEWDKRYRPLKAGEIIAPGDEVLTDSHLGWRKDTHCAGQPAPDPSYTSHRMYRRLIATAAPDVPGLDVATQESGG